MKITFDRTVNRYIVSQCGVHLHYPLTLEDAERLAGMEPQDDRLFQRELSDRVDDEGELSLEGLFED